MKHYGSELVHLHSKGLYDLLSYKLYLWDGHVIALFHIYEYMYTHFQMIVSALSGQWDSLFGGGNLPAFVVGAVAAVISATLAIILLPTPKPDEMAKASIGGGFH